MVVQTSPLNHPGDLDAAQCQAASTVGIRPRSGLLGWVASSSFNTRYSLWEASKHLLYVGLELLMCAIFGEQVEMLPSMVTDVALALLLGHFLMILLLASRSGDNHTWV